MHDWCTLLCAAFPFSVRAKKKSLLQKRAVRVCICDNQRFGFYNNFCICPKSAIMRHPHASSWILAHAFLLRCEQRKCRLESRFRIRDGGFLWTIVDQCFSQKCCQLVPSCQHRGTQHRLGVHALSWCGKFLTDNRRRMVQPDTLLFGASLGIYRHSTARSRQEIRSFSNCTSERKWSCQKVCTTDSMRNESACKNCGRKSKIHDHTKEVQGKNWSGKTID